MSKGESYESMRKPDTGSVNVEVTEVHTTLTTTDKVPDQAFQLDIVDRDPTRMNDHLNVTFSDIFAEPAGTHSFDSIWECSFKTYRGTKLWCYRILSAICAVPAAFCWGISFACLFFGQIWCTVPCIKGCTLQLIAFGKIYSSCIHTFYDPCYDSCSRILSRIWITLMKE
ncbi:caveolin-3-like [Ptychodera flava]|uniref:caveolin-3-like n=1 Tax=Ptychodera flava TaxID=63121 RepID=UPI00396A1585